MSTLIEGDAEMTATDEANAVEQMETSDKKGANVSTYLVFEKIAEDTYRKLGSVKTVTPGQALREWSETATLQPGETATFSATAEKWWHEKTATVEPARMKFS